MWRPLGRSWAVAMAWIGAAGLVAASASAPADTVTLRSGTILRGTVDRDNTIVSVFDGLKRTITRDTKIAKIEPNQSFANFEVFRYVQPIQVHAGIMPPGAVNIRTTPWDAKGRRLFSYVGPRSPNPIRMTQAIFELGPRVSRIRGVDGFWTGQVPTGQIPRPVVMGLLGKVDKGDQGERLRATRFLIQAEWYAEAKGELKSLGQDFPDLKETTDSVLQTVDDLDARRLLDEIAVRRNAGQPKGVLERLKGFPTEGIDPALLAEVRTQLRDDEAKVEADEAFGESLRSAVTALPEPQRKAWSTPLHEVLKGLAEAPDAARARLGPATHAEPTPTPEAKLALAMSGWAAGPDAAIADLPAAADLWKLRGLVAGYLSSPAEADRVAVLEAIRAINPDPAAIAPLARWLGPTIAVEDRAETGAGATIHRVRDDENAHPTEYAILLPPEYSPVRDYPAVIALHDTDQDIEGAAAWWGVEAARRGYIVIAPEYNIPGRPKTYGYSASEHAAVGLALRDAQKRYAIDSDRVFVGGQLTGANMAWDFGLAHPDLVAGAVVISGLPAKYVGRYMAQDERVPLYVVLAEIAPAAQDVIYGGILKPLIARGWDITYAEHYRRGLEDFPEEAPDSFEWMASRRRDPAPKSFKFEAARDSDDRYFGVVIRSFTPGRTTPPESVELTGKNLNPARVESTFSSQTNLLRVKLTGIKKADVWLSPALVDFKRRVEVRVNDKTYLKAVIKPDPGPMLEDLRVRGDRRQLYFAKITAG